MRNASIAVIPGLQELTGFRTSLSSKPGSLLFSYSKQERHLFFWNDLFEASLVAEIELWNSITVLFHLICLKVWNHRILILSLCEISRSDSLGFPLIFLTSSLLVIIARLTACLQNISARISLAINAHWSTILKIHLLPTFST